MKRIVIALCVLMQSSAFAQTFQEHCENAASLPPEQQHFIKKVLAKTYAECDTVQTEVAKRGYLSLAYADIADISLLPSIKGIKSLDLSDNHIDTAAIFSQLPELESLNISKNLISDISPLTKVDRLTQLKASDLPLTSIEPLLKMPNLNELNIQGGTLWDYSPLKNLTNLTSLSVGRTSPINSDQCDRDELRSNIQSLVSANSLDALLPSFTQLESLSSSGLNFTSTKNMEKLKKLRSLEVKCASIEETRVLADLPELVSLNLSHNRLKHVELPPENNKLTYLYLQDNFLTQASFLSLLTEIDTLNLSQNALSGEFMVKSLESLSRLKVAGNNLSKVILQGENLRISVLEVSHNALTHIEFANSKNSLRYFDARGNYLRDPSAGINLSGLHYLDVADNLIEDYSFINEIHGPEEEQDRGLIIKVGGNPSKDFRGITNHRLFDFSARNSDMTGIDNLPVVNGISRIDLGGNKITGLQGLNGKFEYVYYLKLDHNPITSGKSLEELDKLGVIDLSYTKITDYSFLAKMPNMSAITLRGNRIVNLDVLPLIKGLLTIDLAHNNIVDLSVFQKVTREITKLDLSSNLIEDVSPLADLKGRWVIGRPKLANNPLGTKIAKTEQNCPTTTASAWLNRWCRSN